MLKAIRNTIVRYMPGFVLAMIFFPASLFAASLPATRDVVVLPGESVRVEIPIANSGLVDGDISLLLFSATFQSGTDQPQLAMLPADIASWISVLPTSVAVPSGASVPVVLLIDPPVDVTPQAFVIAVVATEKLEGEISLVHGAATLVFVSIGDVSPQGSCESFLQGSSDVAFLSLSNSGRGILYDNGEIVLRGVFGMRLGSTSSNPSFHRISSGQIRTWQVPLPTIPWWAIGPLSYSVDDVQLREHPCTDIDAGARWLPLFGIGIGAIGVMILFIRRRIS